MPSPALAKTLFPHFFAALFFVPAMSAQKPLVHSAHTGNEVQEGVRFADFASIDELRKSIILAANDWRSKQGLGSVSENEAWNACLDTHGVTIMNTMTKAEELLTEEELRLEVVGNNITELSKSETQHAILAKCPILKHADSEEIAMICVKGSRHDRVKVGIRAFRRSPRAPGTLAWCKKCRVNVRMNLRPATTWNTRGCGRCGSLIAITAPDNQGMPQLVNEYLLGYQPPARFGAGISRQEELHAIWQGVWKSCRYVPDNRGNQALRREAFQTGPETMHRGVGDCDDLAVLLADWLLARGFEARVALGTWLGEGHAWVVVRLDGRTYLVEATEPPPAKPADFLPLRPTEVQYVPNMMFDRTRCYMWPTTGPEFDNDYWSGKWQIVDISHKDPPATSPSISGMPSPWKTLSAIQPEDQNDYAWQLGWPRPE